MVKKWAGFTEKYWLETLKWHITTRRFTSGYKAAQCYRWKKRLILCGDWETLPAHIKDNIQVYAYIHEKNNPQIAEMEKRGIEMAIENHEREMQSLKALRAE